MISRMFLHVAVLCIGIRLRNRSNMSKLWNTQQINIPSLAILKGRVLTGFLFPVHPLKKKEEKRKPYINH